MSRFPTELAPELRFAAVVGALVCGLALQGCTTSMSNLTSARTLEQGEFEATVNGSVNLNSAPVRTGVKAGKSIKSEIENTPEDGSISEDTFRDALDFALATTLFRPKPVPEAIFRIGVLDAPLEGIDAGLRFNGSTPKADVKLQYWGSDDDNWAASIQAGFGYQSSIGPSALEYITLTEWKRYDLDILAPFGYAHEDIARVWVAPRFVYSHISASPKIDEFLRKRLPPQIEENRKKLFGGNENIYQAGLNIGGMVGYKFAHFALEATVSRVFFRPTILGEQRNLSGFSIVPSAAVILQF